MKARDLAEIIRERRTVVASLHKDSLEDREFAAHYIDELDRELDRTRRALATGRWQEVA